MKYSIEIGKIVEGALRYDMAKVTSYTEQLIEKLNQDGDSRAASKFERILSQKKSSVLTPMGADMHAVPVDEESRMPLADVVYPDENKEAVILTRQNEEKLCSFIQSYQNADKLNAAGVGVSHALLLYGPPGCGKTKCAYLIARELHLPLVTARLDSLISSYLGTTAKNIRTLFEYAQRMPCVLFLDEFDAIAKARDDSNELGELKRVVNSLLQNVDAMSNDSLLVAATNHEQLLDPAVWRRFDSRIEIEKPDIEAEIKLIDLFSDKAGSFTDKEKYEMALAFQGFSGAEIETIIVNAIRTSVIEDVPFDIKSVFHQYFLFRNIAPQDIHDQKEETEAEARYLRAINSKVFSIQVIADILGCSKSSIQRILKEKKDE